MLYHLDWEYDDDPLVPLGGRFFSDIAIFQAVPMVMLNALCLKNWVPPKIQQLILFVSQKKKNAILSLILWGNTES